MVSSRSTTKTPLDEDDDDGGGRSGLTQRHDDRFLSGGQGILEKSVASSPLGPPVHPPSGPPLGGTHSPCPPVIYAE